MVIGDRRVTRKRKLRGLGCRLDRRGFGPSGKRRSRVASLARKISGEGRERVLASTKRDAGTRNRARVGIGIGIGIGLTTLSEEGRQTAGRPYGGQESVHPRTELLGDICLRRQP